MDIDTLDSPFPPTIPELEEALGVAFPQVKINGYPRTLLLRNGMVMTVVRLRGNLVRVRGQLNAQHVGVLLPIALGVVFGLAGALIVVAVLLLVFGEKAKDMEREVSDFLKKHLQENRDNSDPSA